MILASGNIFFIQLARNEELAIELLNLVNNKAALMRQVAILTNSDPGEVGDPSAEIDRVKAIVTKNSHGKIKVNFLQFSFLFTHISK